MTLDEQIKIAESRIEEHKKARESFIKEYEATGSKFYANLAMLETKNIAEINRAIVEVIVRKD